jgi:hypothetical protein
MTNQTTNIKNAAERKALIIAILNSDVKDFANIKQALECAADEDDMSFEEYAESAHLHDEFSVGEDYEWKAGYDGNSYVVALENMLEHYLQCRAANAVVRIDFVDEFEAENEKARIEREQERAAYYE